MRADVIDKSTGNIVHVPGDSIDLSSPSVVRLDIDRSQITALERQGNDLIVHLANGETIRVSNFYVQANGAASDLVVREGDHLWLANTAASGPARFAALHGIDDLLIGAGAEAAGGGGGALLPVLLGGAAVAGGAAALAGGGSSRGGSSPGTTVDTTPPSAPTATVSGNGASVTGTGEAGATVQVRDGSGALLGSGTVGSNGSYSVTLTQPQTNGQTVTVTQADPAGNVSAPTTAHAPDTTPPAAPTGTVNPNGTIVTGTGEPGATVTVRNGSDAVIGTAVVNAQGNYSVTLTTPQNNGGTLAVTQTDAAGNGSNAINLAAPDITPPSAPTAIMDPHTFTVSGSAEPGATVTVTDAAGRPLGGTVANADGGYSIALPPAVFDGEPVTVVQTDPAGNHPARRADGQRHAGRHGGDRHRRARRHRHRARSRYRHRGRHCGRRSERQLHGAAGAGRIGWRHARGHPDGSQRQCLAPHQRDDAGCRRACSADRDHRAGRHIGDRHRRAGCHRDHHRRRRRGDRYRGGCGQWQLFRTARAAPGQWRDADGRADRWRGQRLRDCQPDRARHHAARCPRGERLAGRHDSDRHRRARRDGDRP